MSLWSHSRDCAGQKHFGELYMRTNSMHVGLHMNPKGLRSSWGCCFLIGRNGSREQIDDVSHANESRHPQNNTPIVFLALWFVTSYMSHMYYILAILYRWWCYILPKKPKGIISLWRLLHEDHRRDNRGRILGVCFRRKSSRKAGGKVS